MSSYKDKGQSHFQSQRVRLRAHRNFPEHCLTGCLDHFLSPSLPLPEMADRTFPGTGLISQCQCQSVLDKVKTQRGTTFAWGCGVS